jgi:hypothetical protein
MQRTAKSGLDFLNRDSVSAGCLTSINCDVPLRQKSSLKTAKSRAYSVSGQRLAIPSPFWPTGDRRISHSKSHRYVPRKAPDLHRSIRFAEMMSGGS